MATKNQQSGRTWAEEHSRKQIDLIQEQEQMLYKFLDVNFPEDSYEKQMCIDFGYNKGCAFVDSYYPEHKLAIDIVNSIDSKSNKERAGKIRDKGIFLFMIERNTIKEPSDMIPFISQIAKKIKSSRKVMKKERARILATQKNHCCIKCMHIYHNEEQGCFFCSKKNIELETLENNDNWCYDYVSKEKSEERIVREEKQAEKKTAEYRENMDSLKEKLPKEARCAICRNFKSSGKKIGFCKKSGLSTRRKDLCFDYDQMTQQELTERGKVQAQKAAELNENKKKKKRACQYKTQCRFCSQYIAQGGYHVCGRTGTPPNDTLKGCGYFSVNKNMDRKMRSLYKDYTGK